MEPSLPFVSIVVNMVIFYAHPFATAQHLPLQLLELLFASSQRSLLLNGTNNCLVIK